MVKGIEIDTDAPRHLSRGLIRRVDDSLSSAVESVEEREHERVTVTAAFTVQRTKEGEVAISYALKGTTTEKGVIPAHSLGQVRLLEEE